MLAVFAKSDADFPSELKSASIPQASASTSLEILNKFKSNSPSPIVLQFDDSHTLAYTHEHEGMLFHRQFAAVEDIFCLFAGNLNNLPQLRQQYGLQRNVSEVYLIIEAYKVLRDRAPYPPDQVVGDFQGPFSFVLFDSINKSIFVAVDNYNRVPLSWGISGDHRFIFSDDSRLLKDTCGRSFAQFPIGCFFSTHHGLRSYVHPLNPLKPIPHIDSEGQLCGSDFKVDMHTELSGMKHVGSEANWQHL